MFKDFYKGSVIIFVGLLIGKFIAMANNVLMARLLSTHQFGIFMIGLTVFRLITIPANFGVPSLLPKFVSESNSKKKFDELAQFVSQGVLITFIFSTILAILAFFSAKWIANSIFHTAELVPVINVVSLAVPLGVLSSVLVAVYRGLQRNYTKVLLEDLLLPCSKCMVFLLLIYFGLGLKAAYISFTVSYLVLFLIALTVLISTIKIDARSFFKFDSATVKKILRLSWPLSIQSFIWIIYSQIDRVFIGYFLEPSQVGIYVASFSIVLLLSFLPQAFSFQALPTFSKMMANNDDAAYTSAYRRVSKVLFLVSLPLLVCISIFAEEIITLLYGERYLAGVPVLVILIIGYFSRCVIGPAAQSLITLGKTRKPMIATLAGCITNVILNIIMIPRFGLIGAAIATSISIAVSEILMGYFNFKYLRVVPFDYSYLIWGAICLALIPVVGLLYAQVNVSWLILKITFGCGIYLILSYSILYFLFYKQSIVKANALTMR